jgi:hypothetical protein
MQSRLVSRSAIALGAAFGCIAVAKFALGPLGFFDQTRGRTIETFVGQQTLILLAGLAILVLYVVAISVFTVSFLDAASHPERVRIGYKA